MKINSISLGYTSDKLLETKEFYKTFFDAEIIYEIEGYLILKFCDLPFVFEFASSVATDSRKSDLTGVGINIDVDDVEKIYEEMVMKGIDIDMPLAKHEWGETAFSIKDPNGLTIYICKSGSR